MMKRACAVLLCCAVELLCLSGCGDAEHHAPEVSLPTQLTDAPGFSGENAYVHCAAICALGPRPTGSPAYAEQVRYIVDQLQRVGWQVAVDTFYPIPLSGRSMQNVRAFFGESAAVRPLIICCHIDTKGQGADAILGADDGASGAAAILELARVLASESELAQQVELVFFDGEESLGAHITEDDGLYGSRFDVERRGEALPRRMINLDMVGGAGKTIAVPMLDTSDSMYAHYERAIRTLGLSPERWTLYPGSYWDDHRPFVEAGVETLNLIAHFQRGTWWHTQRDNMSRISPASLGETGRLALQLIRQMLAEQAGDQSS